MTSTNLTSTTGNALAAALVALALLAGPSSSFAGRGSNSPNATIVDLTGNNNSGTINGGIFTFTDQQPTGTGVIDPFLRVQNSPQEEGYNTSGGTPFDDKAGPWTHDITFADLQTTMVSISNVLYFAVLLDLNEPNGATKSTISLDQLQFYTSSVGSKTTTNVPSLGALRYSFNVGDYVLMDGKRNHGSGSGDMVAYIPVENFAGTLPTDFVYMYTHFGSHAEANGDTAGGFEEWALLHAAVQIPEPSSVALLLISLAGAAVSRRFRRS